MTAWLRYDIGRERLGSAIETDAEGRFRIRDVAELQYAQFTVCFEVERLHWKAKVVVFLGLQAGYTLH